MNAEDTHLMYELLEDMRRVVERNDPTPDHSADKSPRSSEVNFKCYLPENQDEVWLYANASRMYGLLWEIDQKCRSVCKYENKASEDRVAVCEEIREMIRAEIDLTEVA